jgi:hypothetical protein
VRARSARLTQSGHTTYSDFWGYEVKMLEELGVSLGFRWELVPPLDGEWGAVGEDGRFSGLMGQAAYGEVDWVMSSVMMSRWGSWDPAVIHSFLIVNN